MEASAQFAQDVPVVAAGQRGQCVTVLRRAIAVEHVLLNDVHASSVDPFPALRPWIDGARQTAPALLFAALTMEG